MEANINPGSNTPLTDPINLDPEYQPGGAMYISPAVVASMETLVNLLRTDVAATWALAGELSGGSPALRMTLFAFGPIGIAAVAVGVTAYQATTALDNYLDGALHEAFGAAVGKVISMEPGRPDPYFGSDGFTTNGESNYAYFGDDGWTDEDELMMSDICSNWLDLWPDVPVENVGVAPPIIGYV